MASDCAHGGCRRFSANGAGARRERRRTRERQRARRGGRAGMGTRRNGARGGKNRAQSEAQGDAGAEDEKARHGAGNCGGAAAQRILRGDSERFGGFPERPARRKRRGAGKEVAGARGGGVDGNPLLPRPVRGFRDAPATRFRRSSPARRSPFSPSASAPASFPGCSETRRQLAARCPQGTHVHAPRFPQGRKPPPPPPPHARSSAFSSSFTFPHTSPRALPCAAPLAPARTPPLSPPAAHKKRAEFPPRVCSCGPDAAAVHRRIRTCIQNEARRASRS